jgi:hypothetical protein
MILLARIPDDQIALLARVTEDLRDIAFIRHKHLRMMRRYIFYRADTWLILQPRRDLSLPVLVCRRP